MDGRTDARMAPETGAEDILVGLKDAGVRWIFANAGTDFPPIIEGMVRLPAQQIPEPVTVPFESVAMGMAHGVWLATGEPQAVMVHVNVGLANCAMGAINATADDVPIVLMSGRTPLTETHREGHRASPVQYGQEMFDQAALVRESVKWEYELRYPEQGAALVRRAVATAKAAPAGPVYLSLPKEPLSERMPADRPAPRPQPALVPAGPDPEAVEVIAEWLSRAEAPVILVNRGDPAGRLGPALSGFCGEHGIAVAEPFVVRNVLATDDPSLIGYDPAAALEGADLILALDCDVPWIEAMASPGQGARVIHAGPDPLFGKRAVRDYRTDLAVVSDPVLLIHALDRAMPEAGERAAARKARIAARPEWRRDPPEAADGPMAPGVLARAVSDVMDDDAVAVSELGLLPGAMRLKGQNRLFQNSHAGGLGWAMPTALGAQLARPGKLTIAAMGDGSYMFANPVACHQVAEALGLPILTIVKNNAMWNAVRRGVISSYPGGAASGANRMPLVHLDPLPDFAAVARASRAHAERVETAAELRPALDRAVAATREGRQALLDVVVAVSDAF